MYVVSRADGELTFDEFSSWYLEQEGLPEGFSAPSDGGALPVGSAAAAKTAKDVGVFHVTSLLNLSVVLINVSAAALAPLTGVATKLLSTFLYNIINSRAVEWVATRISQLIRVQGN